MLSIGCETGKYGPQCQKTCGYCLDQSECFHTNGTCLTGCLAGYQGVLCATRKREHRLGLYEFETTISFFWNLKTPLDYVNYGVLNSFGTVGKKAVNIT